jgi:nicotinamidase-related amidase
MPITNLDSICALIVIDLQKGVAAMPSAHPMSGIVERSAQLARAFRERELPVVLVNVAGMAPGRTDAGLPKFAFPDGWTDLLPELEACAGDLLVTKQRWGAFLGTDLDMYLRRRGVTQIVLAGVATSIGVESTARSAYDLGYHVVLALDAMTDRDPQAHEHSVGKIFPRLGQKATTAEILQMLPAR